MDRDELSGNLRDYEYGPPPTEQRACNLLTMGYTTTTSYSYVPISSTTTTKSSSGFDLRSLFQGVISYILLPPLLVFYAVAAQVLTAIELIDTLAENKYVQLYFKYLGGAIAIAGQIALTILGWLNAPFAWFANTFVYKALYEVYIWVKTTVYGWFGWRVL
ncbi:hypothetical protein DL93DRAFT_64132 [Clavulina sp. PMI_390]|nr:hypothetical protein DL93DRAFT_64132 [Clavulina sp. PMI_390]